jgi:hypothetical protein
MSSPPPPARPFFATVRLMLLRLGQATKLAQFDHHSTSQPVMCYNNEKLSENIRYFKESWQRPNVLPNKPAPARSRSWPSP